MTSQISCIGGNIDAKYSFLLLVSCSYLELNCQYIGEMGAVPDRVDKTPPVNCTLGELRFRDFHSTIS